MTTRQSPSAGKPAADKSAAGKSAAGKSAAGERTAGKPATGPQARPGLDVLLARLSGSSLVELPADLIELGRIGDPYGIKGWINVNPHSGDNSALKHAKIWFLGWSETPFQKGSGKPVAVRIQTSRMHSGRLVAQLQGIDDRNDAEKLKGAQVWVSRAEFPPLKKGEFYWVDLIGLAVINREGLTLGTITEVTDHGAHPILCIAPPQDAGPDAEERLIPFVPAYVDRVDLDDRTVRVDWQADF